MNDHRKSAWLVVVSLIVICLAVSACNPQAADDCQGDISVTHDSVARVTPSPREEFLIGQSYSWTAPPFGVKVTGSDGEAVMQIFTAANALLAKYTIYAADIVNGDVSVEKWNGLSEITFNAGNFVIEDNGSQDICNLDLFAGGVGIASVGTTYILTVRPDINQVIVAVLDGIVEVTSQGQTVRLDSAVPSEVLVVVDNGKIGPLLPIPDPSRLLQEVSIGHDIPFEILQPDGQTEPQTPGDQIEPPSQSILTLWADERLMPVLEGIAAQFEKDTGTRLMIEAMPLSDIPQRYLATLQAGTAPDLVTIQHQQIYELAANGWVMPVELGVDPDLFVPGTVRGFSYKGDTYGLPYTYDNLALISNRELIAEIPSTWNELMRLSAEISKGREFFTGLAIPSGGYFFYPLQSAFGGYIFGTFRDGTFNSDDLGMISDGSLKAAAFFEEMVKSQPIFMIDEETALQYFGGWNAAMLVTGPWRLQQLRELGVPFQVNSFPSEVQVSQPFLGVYGFVISRNSQNLDAAQNLLWNYLASYQAVQGYSATLGIPPARRDILEKLEDADVRAFGLAGIDGVPIPYIPEMDYVWGPWTDAINAIISQEMAAIEAFESANAIISKQLGR
jgi:maltose-binding protein MalE